MTPVEQAAAFIHSERTRALRTGRACEAWPPEAVQRYVRRRWPTVTLWHVYRELSRQDAERERAA